MRFRLTAPAVDDLLYAGAVCLGHNAAWWRLESDATTTSLLDRFLLESCIQERGLLLTVLLELLDGHSSLYLLYSHFGPQQADHL